MATGLLLDAAVVGIPDPIKGTAVVCVCVPRPGIDRDAAMQAPVRRGRRGPGRGVSSRPTWSSFPTCRALAT